MGFARPDAAAVADLASRLGMTLAEGEADRYLALMAGNLAAYEAVDQAEVSAPAVAWPRGAGHAPTAEENPLGAWAWIGDVAGAAQGPLAGLTAVIKDNVAVAGFPMQNGSPTLAGFIPERDATVVTRLLAAGATVTGKAVCESFCLSGGSHTSYPGPVHNPRRMGFSAGGSSSGSAALVAAGVADLAIGGDQGGSVRIPASFCGIVGMKATHGLVPYTGAMPIEATLDHLGPMTRDVATNARMLDVIAGVDGLDPRQGGMPAVPAKCETALSRGVEGLKIGLLAEGFTLQGLQQAVAESVRAGAERLAGAGARLTEISIPEHSMGPAIWAPIGCEGMMAQMMHGNGMGHNWKGAYSPDLMAAHAGWRSQADALSPSLKLSMLMGQWGAETGGGRYYAKAQNLARALTRAYDAALAEVDLILMPTLPMVATPLPGPNAEIEEIVTRAFEMSANTCVQDITGHPAISVPCGMVQGLPVGLMLVGRAFDEPTVYAAAAALEAAGDWTKL